MILKPIRDEESQDNCINKEAYKAIFKRCHQDLKQMKIGHSSKADFFQSHKNLQEIIVQADSLKSVHIS